MMWDSQWRPHSIPQRFKRTKHKIRRNGFSKHAMQHIRIHVKCHLFCPEFFLFLLLLCVVYFQQLEIILKCNSEWNEKSNKYRAIAQLWFQWGLQLSSLICLVILRRESIQYIRKWVIPVSITHWVNNWQICVRFLLLEGTKPSDISTWQTWRLYH